MRRILAIGGGGFMMEDAPSLIDKHVISLTEKARPRVCYLATPSGDLPAHLDKFHTAYGNMGCETSHLAFFRQPDSRSISVADFRARVLEQDAIYVGGGNTKSALAIWRELFGVRVPAGAGLRQVAARLCLSERTLRRRSLDLFGHAPARLGAIARLQRFLAAVRAHPSEGLAELAFSAGYADQSHLSRECRRFIGLSPGAVKRQFAPMLADPFKTGAVIGG